MNFIFLSSSTSQVLVSSQTDSNLVPGAIPTVLNQKFSFLDLERSSAARSASGFASSTTSSLGVTSLMPNASSIAMGCAADTRKNSRTFRTR